MPEIISRATWGARPPRGRLYAMRLPVAELWLHHTVTRVTDDPAADARSVQEVSFGRGFTDVSYSYLVHPSGAVLEGRGHAVVGAHTYGRNRVSLGVALIGNYERRVFMDVQVEAVRWLVAELVRIGALRAGAYPTGGHRDLKATACPGAYAYRELDRLRRPWEPAPKEGIVELNHPPRVIVNRPQGDGYWIVAYDGGVFAFGEAPVLAAIGGDPVERIVSASAWPDGEGLTCLGEDGGVFALGSARYLGRVEWRG